VPWFLAGWQQVQLDFGLPGDRQNKKSNFEETDLKGINDAYLHQEKLYARIDIPGLRY
jgi:hypothetical protein